MPDDVMQQKILQLLDVLSVELGATHAGVNRLEQRFDSLSVRVDELGNRVDELGNRVDELGNRLDRRLGNVETRIEGLETDFRFFRVETDRRLSALEARPN